MNPFELVLRALTAANLATPGIVSIIGALRTSKDSGQTDDEALEHASQVAQETRDITTRDMGNQP